MIVSFHDLHPGSRPACMRLLTLMAEAGFERAALLVVPRWHAGPPFTADPAFVAWLRELSAVGHEICLHGYTHRAERVTGGPIARLIGHRYTAQEGEFFQISRADAEQRIRAGLDLMARAGLPIYGFTPPAWLLSTAGRAALTAAGLHYTTTWGGVDLLQADVCRRVPTLVYSCRNAWRRFVSRMWVRVWHRHHRHAPVLRLAVHPGDLADPRLTRSLAWHLATAAADGRGASTYRDLLPGGAMPLPPSPLIAA